jgi:hypothetical protein
MATKTIGRANLGLGLASILVAVGCSSDPGPAPGPPVKPAQQAATSDPGATSEPAAVIIPHAVRPEGRTHAIEGAEITDWEVAFRPDATHPTTTITARDVSARHLFSAVVTSDAVGKGIQFSIPESGERWSVSETGVASVVSGPTRGPSLVTAFATLKADADAFNAGAKPYGAWTCALATGLMAAAFAAFIGTCASSAEVPPAIVECLYLYGVWQAELASMLIACSEGGGGGGGTSCSTSTCGSSCVDTCGDDQPCQGYACPGSACGAAVTGMCSYGACVASAVCGGGGECDSYQDCDPVCDPSGDQCESDCYDNEGLHGYCQAADQCVCSD